VDKIIVDGEELRIKVATLNGRVIRATPEFEDCKAIAQKNGKRLRDVIDEAKATCHAMVGIEGSLTPRF
jgi:uncharacterized protein (DUF111 family)